MGFAYAVYCLESSSPKSFLSKRLWSECWTPKNWCIWTVVLEKMLEGPLDSQEIQPVHSERNQSWIFIGRTDAEAETPILWPPDLKNWLIWKKPCCWEILKAGGEGDDRGWDGWMASPTWWKWVWVNFGSWWWTGSRLSVWTELNWMVWMCASPQVHTFIS